METKDEALNRITGAEWRVMQCLWAQGPLRMAELVAALSERTGWSRTTVLTLTARLEKKGFIGSERSRRAYLYAPLVPRRQALAARVEAFVEETLEGSFYELGRLIAEGAYLSAEEERKLRARFKPAAKRPDEGEAGAKREKAKAKKAKEKARDKAEDGAKAKAKGKGKRGKKAKK